MRDIIKDEIHQPRRRSWAWALTGIYLAGLAAYIYLDRAEFAAMNPPSWGDFLGGAFGPLAFFWLIMGYLQQGEELKHSTHALNLQAKELQNSVDQQRQMVEISRQQVAAEIAAAEDERERMRFANSPRFIAGGVGATHNGGGSSQHSCYITNVGADAHNVQIIYPFNLNLEFIGNPYWPAREQRKFIWRFSSGEERTDFDVTISHQSVRGDPAREVFGFYPIETGLHVDYVIEHSIGKIDPADQADQ